MVQPLTPSTDPLRSADWGRGGCREKRSKGGGGRGRAQGGRSRGVRGKGRDRVETGGHVEAPPSSFGRLFCPLCRPCRSRRIICPLLQTRKAINTWTGKEWH